MNKLSNLSLCLLSPCLLLPYGYGQAKPSTGSASSVQTEAHPAPAPDTKITHIFRLTGVMGEEANELLSAVSLMMEPSAREYLLRTQNSIVVRASQEQITEIGEFIRALDRPHRTFRLSYTLTTFDGARKSGVQRFSMIAADGQRVTLKSGSRLPLSLAPSPSAKGEASQIAYVDIGYNFDATPSDSPSGIRLQSKVETSSVAEDSSHAAPQDPVVRQAVLQGTSMLSPGKPLLLGSIDVPESNRHLDIEVTIEALP